MQGDRKSLGVVSSSVPPFSKISFFFIDSPSRMIERHGVSIFIVAGEMLGPSLIHGLRRACRTCRAQALAGKRSDE